jgi:hypothetical protein
MAKYVLKTGTGSEQFTQNLAMDQLERLCWLNNLAKNALHCKVIGQEENRRYAVD